MRSDRTDIQAAREFPDPRPHAVRFQDAAIRDYAVRNRLLRCESATEEPIGDGRAIGAPFAGRLPRSPRNGSARTAARAEGIYRRIAPADQEYPLQAVDLVRRLLAAGAPDEFVQGKYQTHVWNCGDIGVPPVPLIPYLEDLLEIQRLDRNAALRNGTLWSRSVP